MNAKAFISHTERGGTDIGKIIQDQLKTSDHQMESFLSKHSIEQGERIPEKILNGLSTSDILILIIDPLTIKSKWVEWEYTFCVSRKMPLLVYVDKNYITNVHNINWLDVGIKYDTYDFEKYGEIRSKVWRAIANKKSELETNSHIRESTQLSITSILNNTYSEHEKIKISGKTNKLESEPGKCYFHIPQMTNIECPMSTIDLKITIQPIEQNFTFEIEIPILCIAENEQVCFIEVYFESKSIIIPITVSKKDNRENNGKLSDSQSPNADIFTPEMIDTILQPVSDGTYSSIPKYISDHTIVRTDDIKKITKTLEHEDRIVITGNKGAGKSVFLCQLYRELRNNYSILFLRCDNYLNINSLDELNNNIIVDHNFNDVIRHFSPQSKLLVIFDSLDVISRNVKVMDIFKNFIKTLWGMKNIKTISTVRSYDYHYSTNINTIDWGKEITLSSFNTGDIEYILNKLNNPKISSELKKILDVPLNLKLLSLIVHRSEISDFTNIGNELELYEEYWNEYVEKLEFVNKITNTLYDIVEHMIKNQTVSISYDQLPKNEYISELSSRNIIIHDQKINSITFFHHAYLDYVASRFILNNDNFVTYIQEQEYNIFLRPTIVFTLLILYKNDPKRFVNILEQILNSDLKYYWKISALTALSEIKNIKIDLNKIGQCLSNTSALQRHFLIEIYNKKNPFWYNLWNETFFTDWTSQNFKYNFPYVYDYLHAIFDKILDHTTLFKILKNMIENDQSFHVKRIIELASRTLVDEKINFLYALSTNDNQYIRQGVLDAIPNIIDLDLVIISDIFFNIFTYAESSNAITQFQSYGTFTLTSNKQQDNEMIRWDAEQSFPKLLDSNPKIMIMALIKIYELVDQRYLQAKSGDSQISNIVNYGMIDNIHNKENLLNILNNYIDGCDHEKMRTLLPTFQSTKHPVFFNIMITKLIENRKIFVNDIFKILCDPIIYKNNELQNGINIALQYIMSYLNDTKIMKILKIIVDIEKNKEIQIPNHTLIKFLVNFPRSILEPKYVKLLDECTNFETKSNDVQIIKNDPSKKRKKISTSNNIISYTSNNVLSSDEILSKYFYIELDHTMKLDLLKAIMKYLNKKKSTIDDPKHKIIKEFLLRHQNDLDPEENSIDNLSDIHFTVHDSIRGLVSSCLIRLLYNTKDEELIPIIKLLSDDEINIVRSEICQNLYYLFHYGDYDLTLSITKKFSLDPDKRVQFFIYPILGLIARTHPNDAVILIKNIYSTINTTTNIEILLLYLALEKKIPDAIDLLNEIVTSNSYSHEIRLKIPFILKGSYIFKNEFQDKALDILCCLQTSDSPKVREKSAFFTLEIIEKNGPLDNELFINKIIRNLDLIILEVDKTPIHARVLETLSRFLKKFWSYFPIKTITYLEKITRKDISNYSLYQGVYADNSIHILSELLQDANLSSDDIHRCLDILDKFAMAGWPDALKLLSEMERPD